MNAGVTLYARSAQRLFEHGELTLAADWNDSLFVLAVRAPVEAHRQAALMAFTEGLQYRVDAGQACAALARVQWAEKALGGVIPGLDPSIEDQLLSDCRKQRAKGGRG